MDKLSGAIMSELMKGPITADGKLECQIVDTLRLPKTVKSYQNVISWLTKMERKEVIVIKRSGSVMREAKLVPKQNFVSAQHVEKEEVVNVTQPTPPKPGEVESKSPKLQSDVPVTDKGKDSLYIQLSLALLALQTAADENGVLKGASAKLIAKELKIPYTSATPLNGLLGKLGLRKSSSGKTNITHQIDMTTKEVTREMVEALAMTPSPTNIKSEATFVEPTSPARATISAPSVEEQLATVIEGLEAQLMAERLRFEEAANKSAGVIGNMTNDLEEANATIRRLQQEIVILKSPPSERVKSILARHLPETDAQS